MRLLSLEPRHVAGNTALVVLAYVVLFQIVARTRMIEKVMAMNFSAWELATIAAFLGLRVAVYLLVPSVIAAALARSLALRLWGPQRNPGAPRS